MCMNYHSYDICYIVPNSAVIYIMYSSKDYNLYDNIKNYIPYSYIKM